MREPDLMKKRIQLNIIQTGIMSSNKERNKRNAMITQTGIMSQQRRRTGTILA